MPGMQNTLSFSELERRICAIPDGPSSVLNTPRWITRCNVVGTLGVVMGLLPSVLIKVMPPQMWMVFMARSGVWIALIAYAPGFVRGVWVAGRSMWKWKSEQPEQLDHDFVQFRDLAHEISRHSVEAISERLRFVQSGQARLQAKLSFFAGGVDRLGILPLLFAVGIQLKAYNDAKELPLWQAALGLFFAVTYLIGIIGQLMRLRLQLYETVLTEALIACDNVVAEKETSRPSAQVRDGVLTAD
jgi:hypothetical protein